MYETIRRQDREMDVIEVESMLRNAMVGRVAMSWDDQPYVVPVHFVYFMNTIFFHCAHEGRKLDYLSGNSRVCFEVDEFLGVEKGSNPCLWSTKYRSVIAFGHAVLLEDRNKKEIALRGMIEKYGGITHGALDEHTFQRTRVVKITVERMTGKAHRSNSSWQCTNVRARFVVGHDGHR